MMNEMSLTNIYHILIIKRESNVMPPWGMPTFLVDTSLVDHAKKYTLNTIYQSLLNEILDSSLSCPLIYTDVSKTNTGIGIAIVIDDLSLSYKLLGHNSIYSAEYIALRERVLVAVNCLTLLLSFVQTRSSPLTTISKICTPALYQPI